MKKFLLSAIAVSMIATPALAAPGRDFDRDHRGQPQRTVIVKKQVYKPANRFAYRNWRRGERFDYRQARNYRVINDYRTYRLAPPPRGYHYVRSGNDAVLVAVSTGIIASIIAGAIH